MMKDGCGHVYGKIIKFHYNHIGQILECGFQGDELAQTKVIVERDEINHQIFLDRNASRVSKSLRPRARLLERMLINTIIPRSGSHELVYEQDHQALYAIFGILNVNWAQVFHDQIKSF